MPAPATSTPLLPSMMSKLYGTQLGEQIVKLAYDLLGSEGLRAPERSSWLDIAGRGDDVDWVDQYVFELASRIAAGSSNIQRNIIGERGLGLPRDLRAR